MSMYSSTPDDPILRVEQAESPLDSLVRRASSRRVRDPSKLTPLRTPHTPPRQQVQVDQEWPSPNSPLLHTQFRSSVASTAVTSVYNDKHGSYSSMDDRSMLWDPAGSRDHLRHDLHPASTREVSMASQYSMDDITSGYANDWQADDGQPEYNAQTPTVVVSPDPEPETSPTYSHGGRVPSRLPSGHANFSRPVPPPITGTEEQKRQVLMRNAHSHSGTPHSEASQTQALRPSLQQSRSAPTSPVPSSPALPSPVPGQQRVVSQMSLYSNYSYYPYEGATPTQDKTRLSPMPSPTIAVHPPAPEPSAQPANMELNLENPQTAQDFLQLGIQHHLANELDKSADCFEKSATLRGGCGVGMLMWGLTLRHGWGCPKNESKGFKWLRKAAELAVNDLEGSRAGMDTKAIKSELVLAIYEVGQSFFQGWGVEKDKKMAVSYYRLAADLGDPDAQQDLAFCLANGKGCKKDRKEAAKYYRLAVKQGISDIGLAWIYKEKYQ